MEIKFIGKSEARRFVGVNHYNPKCPPHCLEAIGLFEKNKLVGVSLWGWGVRPKHTIQKIFPTLDTKDYRELNRLCVLDQMPRNTESYFISQSLKLLRGIVKSEVLLVISWADGMRNKPGYVYQASNWLYGGFIETEFYIDQSGKVAHPRALITNFGTRTKSTTDKLGLEKLRGKQFLYCYFLCSRKKQKELLVSSPIKWSRNYPKEKDCLVWNAGDVSREKRQATSLQGVVRFHDPAILKLEI